MDRTATDYLSGLLAVLDGRNLTDGNVLTLAGHELGPASVTRLQELVRPDPLYCPACQEFVRVTGHQTACLRCNTTVWIEAGEKP